MTKSKAKPIEPCWVFLAHFNAHGHDYLRIGYADNVDRRIAQMQADIPFEVSVLVKWPARNRTCAKNAEYKAAHEAGFHPVARQWTEGDAGVVSALVSRALGRPEQAVTHHIRLHA